MTDHKHNKWRRWGKWLVTGAVAFSLIGAAVASPAAMAKEGKGKAWGKLKFEIEMDELHDSFRDLNEASWALPIMQQMRLMGIVNGYPDKTFKPNKPVTREEAVVMAVRFIGQEEAALAYNTEGDIELGYQDDKKISSWAKGYIKVAQEEGILDDSDGKFQSRKPAKRAWVSKLAVRSMIATGDIEDSQLEADVNGQTNVYYADLGSVDNQYRVYIVVASQQDWLHGYPDKTFRGNKPVTRAEILTIFGNINNTNNFFDEVRGEFVSSADGTVTLKVKGQETEYTVNGDALIYLNKEDAELADIEAGAEVKAQVNADGEIIFLQASDEDEKDDDENEGELEGAITAISESSITIATEDGTVTYDISDEVEVESDIEGQEDEEFPYDALQVGDTVELEVEDDEVTEIKLVELGTPEEDTESVEGTVDAINESSITLETEDGSASYSVDADVVVTQDGDEIDYADLEAGDSVEVTVEDGTVVEIELVTEADNETASGTITAISDSSISLELEDGTASYSVSEDVEVTMDGEEFAYADLEADDEVEVTIEDGEVTQIEVIQDAVVTVEGQVRALLSNTVDTIVVEDADGNLHSEIVTEDTEINLDGEAAAFADLQIGQQVTLTLESDALVQIDAEG